MRESDFPMTPFSKAPLEILDGDRGKSYPKQEDFSRSGHCLFLNAGNVTKNGFNFEDVMFITREKDQELRKGKLQREDLVLTTRGTVGNVAYFDRNVPYDHVRINSGMVVLRVNQKELDPKYLYCFLRSKLFHDQVRGLITGSAQPQLPIRDILQISIPLIPINTQKRVSEIIGSIDRKIQIAGQINETLESLAKTIFKEWFIDFGPIKAKTEGKKPFGMISKIAGLFPDGFEKSEFGILPKGWKAGRLREVCTVTGGYAFKGSDFTESGHPVVKIKNISESLGVDLSNVDYVSEHIASRVPKFNLKDGSLVMAMTGATVGKYGLVLSSKGPLPVLNQRVALLEPKENNFGFIFSALLTTDIYNQVVNRAEGSAQPNISADGIMDSKLILPTPDIQDAFSTITNDFFNQWKANKKESLLLEETRNLILPKLISGEIELKDINV